MNKKEINKKALLNAFKQSGSLSTRQMMDILNTSSKGTVNTYIRYLREDGVQIDEEILPKGAKSYRIQQIDDYEYEDISKNNWQAFVICSALNDLLLSENNISRKRLIQYILDDKELNLGLKKSSLFNRINELCSSGMLFENTKSEPSSLLPGSDSPRIEAMDLEDAQKLVHELSVFPDSDPFHDTLSSIKEGLSELSDLIESSELPPQYIRSGKDYDEKSVSSLIHEHFKDCNYKKYLCDIIYNPKRNLQSTAIRVGIGLIVYVVEKDNIYAIGNIYNNETISEKIILQVDRIEKATEARDINGKILNPDWNSSEFKQIFEEMLSISTEEAQGIKVRFDDLHFVENKIDVLIKQRKTASLTKKEGYLEYTDTIRGLSDLRSYLRSFMNSYVVLEPTKLRDDTIINLIKSLKLYGESV